MIKDKRGQVGLDIVKGVIMTLLVLTILGVVLFLVFSNLQPVVSNLDTYTNSGSTINETITSVTETGKNLAVYSYDSVVCTITNVINATDGVAIPAANRTTTNCNLRYSGPTGIFNNTNWKVSYTYTYRPKTSSANANGVGNNISSGIVSFFTYVPTIMAILAVVVIIAAVAILIFYVKGFEGGGEKGI